MADVLVFGAHPDDAEFGMGASMVKFVRSGASVTVCVLSRGEAGTFGNPDQREGEMRAAVKKLGGEIEILSFRDCKIQDTYEARVELAQVIRKHRPKMVFAPYHTNNGNPQDGSAHPDHMATGMIARSAVRYARLGGVAELKGDPWTVGNLIYYMVPLSVTPTIVNDVTPFITDWEAVARCHESQMNIRGGVILQVLKSIKSVYGIMRNVGYGEAFVVDGPLSIDLSALMGK